MNKYLLTIATVFFFGISEAQTNIYHPFPDSAAVWNFEAYKWCGVGFDNWQHNFSITTAGDTTINSISYKKLSVPIEIVISNGQCFGLGSWTIPGHYVGAFRQNTQSKKVYFIAPDSTTEHLLYDFNLNVGDTVKGYLESFATPKDTVISIDSVLVGSTYRKRWNINSGYNISIIEGIGSTYGLTEKSPGVLTDMSDYTITCFRQNNQTLYPDTAAICELLTALNGNHFQVDNSSVTPNPFTDRILVKTSNSDLMNLTIYNLFGEKLIQQNFNKQVEISTAVLPDGVYIYQIESKSGFIKTGKLVK